MPHITILLILYAFFTTILLAFYWFKKRVPTEEKNTDIIQYNMIVDIASTLPASCVMTSNDGKVLYANDVFLCRCGYKLEELVGQKISMLKASIETDYVSGDLWRHLEDGKVWRGPFINQTKTGEVYTDEFVVFPVHQSSGILYCALSYNVANRYLEEKALEKVQRQSIHFRENFISNLSHEVRTPLNALIGLSQLGQKNEHPERHLDYFSKINIASKQLMQLMDDILDFSKIESGSFALVKSRFNFMSLLSAIISQYATQAAEKNLEFNIDVDEFSPQYMFADSFRLEQILSNLVSNAIKFTDEGEVHLHIGLTKAVSKGYELIIRISDTGKGMSQEMLDGLFNPFIHLVSDNQKRHNKSSGLGMAITKQIVDLMQGQIVISSKPQVGTEIAVTLPFDGNDLELPKNSDTSGVEHLDVLVIDDSTTSKENARKILTGFGYAVTLASSGQEALDLIELGRVFSLIMIDWRMPGLSSENTVIEISKLASNQPRILFITPFGPSGVEAQAKRLIHGYLPKPYTPSMLFDEIASLFIRTEVGSQPELVTEGLFKNLNVLLVDDNAVNNTIAKNLFEQEGARAVTFTKATRALEYLDRHPVDFIVSDIDMPEMDGYEFLIALKKAGFPYKVSALTANTSDKNRQDILNAGFDVYLSKPLTKEKLQTLYESLELEENRPLVAPVPEHTPVESLLQEIDQIDPNHQRTLKVLFETLLIESKARRPKVCKEQLGLLEIQLNDHHLSLTVANLLIKDLQKYRFDHMIETLEVLIEGLGGIENGSK